MPSWFPAALAAEAEVGETEVAGTTIRFRSWGDRDHQGVVLVHGGAAHSRWWDHVAPILAREYRVTALDLSGHGDSGRRDAYSIESWSDEVIAVAGAAAISGPPVIVGHSMGGFVTLATAGRYGPQLDGVVIIDSPVHELTPEQKAARERQAFGPLRVYQTRELALSRFRPVPDSGTALPYVVDHVAAQSIREVPGGWSWKFDPRIFGRIDDTPKLYTRLNCRVALFRPERGLVSPQMSDDVYDRLGRAAPVVEIPDAGHHVMLDQPLALVTGLRAILADWEHSTPAVPTDSRS